MTTISKTSNLYKRALAAQIQETVSRGLYDGDSAKAENHLRTFDPYELVCDWMGFNSLVKFVSFHRGRVGFTLGKPNEIQSLQSACVRLNIPMTKSLQNFSR